MLTEPLNGGVTTHVIEVYEPLGSLNQNPLHVAEVGIIKTQDRAEYFLANLDQPFNFDGEEVTQVILQPRYYGDKTIRAQKDMCTITIFRVRPECKMDESTVLDLTRVTKWGCGKINPVRNGKH